MKVLTFLFLSAMFVHAAGLDVIGLRAEHEVNPVGITTTPRLSWQLSGEKRGKRQNGFQLLAASSAEKLAADQGDLWDHTAQKSGFRMLISWKGSELKEGQKVFWKVRVWDEKSVRGKWSAPASFTVGSKRKLQKVTRLSSFESSNEVLNRVYRQNVALLEKRLNAYVAGDDQALGNGHQVQRSVRELLYHFDAAPALLDWVGKVYAEQDDLGYFPGGPGQPFGVVHSDAAIAVPHALWWMNKETDLIVEGWKAMENYMIQREKADRKINGHAWGAPLKNADKTPPEYVDLCYFGLTSRLMLELARPANQPRNSIRYRDYAARARNSFVRQYLDENGLLKVPTQTAAILGLRCSVMTAEQRVPVIQQFVKGITPLKDVGGLAAKPLLPVLALTGNQDLAFDFVTDPKGPWADEKREDFAGSGATEWMMSMLAGIDAAIPGFQQIRIAPRIPSGERLKWLKARYNSPAGEVLVHWEKGKDGVFKLNCTVPPGTLATIVLPITVKQSVTDSGKTLKESFGVDQVRRDDAAGIVELIAQAGSYQFVVK